jgi:hypothetical protein
MGRSCCLVRFPGDRGALWKLLILLNFPFLLSPLRFSSALLNTRISSCKETNQTVYKAPNSELRMGFNFTHPLSLLNYDIFYLAIATASIKTVNQ